MEGEKKSASRTSVNLEMSVPTQDQLNIKCI